MGALVGVGLALVGAIVATWLLESFVQAKAPLAMFLLSTILIAAWLGWRYAVFTAVAGVALSRWLFVDAAQVSAHYPRLAVYFGLCACLSYLTIAVRRKLVHTREQLEGTLASLQISERRLQMALSAGAMMAWETDLSTDRTVASEHAEQLWGFRAGESDDYMRQIHPDDRERTRSDWQRGTETGGEYLTEYRVMRPDGVRWYESRGRVLRDAEGKPTRVVGVTTDRTERHCAEDVLRRSEARFRQLADAMPQIVWATDARGQVIYMNSRWQTYTGMPADAALGEAWAKVIEPSDLPAVKEGWQQALAQGSPFETQARLRMADQSFRWFAVRALPVANEDGRVVTWFGSNTDIDELKRMAQALIAADKRKDEFLATLAHELRNPLAPLRNGLFLLKHAGDDALTVARTQDLMERQLGHLMRLVDDLLDVGRISSGAIPLRLGDLDLRQVALDAVEICRPLLEGRGHSLTLDIPDEPAPLHGDAGRLTQAVSNLLTNAARYTAPGGQVTVRLRTASAGTDISVEDNGVGLAPDMLESVFELFTQVKGNTNGHDGLGIGLSIVRRLVELHGGTARAESRGLGQGSRFIVSLPRRDNPLA